MDVIARQKRILVVDDDPLVAQLIQQQIADTDRFKVVVAQSGKEALQKIERKHPDTMIIDVVMPDMDGIELIHALADLKYRGPIVLISGSSLDMLDVADVIANGLNLNVLGAFNKPLSRHRVEEILKGSLA
jgi:CheY-like chemotaxis protein